MVLPAARSHNLVQGVNNTKRFRRCQLSCDKEKYRRYTFHDRDIKKGKNLPDCGVHTPRYDLRIGFLAFDICNGASVAGKDMNLGLCSHVPNSS